MPRASKADGSGAASAAPKKKTGRFGRFRLLRKLGEGGMGAVYLAEESDGQRYALKILNRDEKGKKGAKDRFQREMRITMRLQHPHIVQTFDVGRSAKNTMYMLMEYCPGGSLRSLLKRRGPILVQQALPWMACTAEALDYAYREHSVIHRDIKPANILLDDAGHAKLCDFGMARRTASDATRMTIKGTVLGSALYMSPEQALGEEDIDVRSDLYSLGASFYHLLGGVPLFPGDNWVELIEMQVNKKPVRLSRHRRDLPKPLVQLIHDLLNKDRRRRPSSSAELLYRLQKVARTTGINLSPPVAPKEEEASAPKPPKPSKKPSRKKSGKASPDALPFGR